MRKTRTGGPQRIIAALAMLILGLGTMLVGFVGAANADDHVDLGDEECVPSDGTSASFSEWAPSGLTDVQHGDSTPPADPDGQSGDDNPMNLKMIGSPAQTQKHVTQEAQAPTDGQWENLQWNVYAGNWNTDDAPSVNDPHWQPTGAEPNGQHAGRTPGVPYEVDRSNGNGSDWFLWTGTWVEGSDGQDEVSHTDYQWPILERTYTPGTDPVTCGPDVLGTDARQRTVTGDPNCETGTVPVTVQRRDGEETSAGVWEWSEWKTVSESTRPATKKECPGIETKPNESSSPNPGDPGNPGGGGDPEVLGIEANAPAANAPAAAPTAVDAGLMAQEPGSSSSMLWIMAGAAFALAGLVLGFSPATPRGKRAL